MRKNLLLFLCFLQFSITLSQVGINTTEPNMNSLLHVSEKMTGTISKSKGILIPRLTLSERDQLTFSDPPNNSNVRLTGDDNSLMIFNVTENCYNYWNDQESEWKSLCGNIGDGKFNFTCGNNIKVNGNYIKGKELNTSNYISMTVNVTKIGNYVIKAGSASSNGYSFVSQGIFSNLGPQTVRLQGQGIPVMSQTDSFNITASDPTSSCIGTSIIVQPDIASYALNCSSIVISGNYIKGNALNASNIITLSVNVATVGSYNISTVTTNGVIFSGSGIFSSTGTQNVTLVGSGAPTVNENFVIILQSNTSSGNSTCSFEVPITLPAMTYAVIGADNVYSWHPNNVRAKAFNGESFGPSGTVKIVSLQNIWNTTSNTTAISNLTGQVKPDILLYFSFGSSPSTSLALALNNYVNAGGVLIFGSRDGETAETNIILNGIFGQSNAQQQIAGTGSIDDNIYPINNSPSDPIINGPFGNASGKYWGEDNSSTGTIIVTQLPPNSVQIASANNQFSKFTVNPSYSTVWYNKLKNFVYFGDSTGATSSDNSLIAYPTRYTSTGRPETKRYGQYPNENSQSQFVYNSILELNAVAWALKKAAVSGINPH